MPAGGSRFLLVRGAQAGESCWELTFACVGRCLLDFADLLFEEDEEDEKDKSKLAAAKTALAAKADGRSAPGAGAKAEPAEGAGADEDWAKAAAEAPAAVEEAGNCEKMEMDGAVPSAQLQNGSSGVTSESNAVKVENADAPNSVGDGAAKSQDADMTGASVEEGEVEVLCDWLKVGSGVEVEWGGEWWEGTVRKIVVTSKGKSGKVEISYVGGEEDEAEWIEISYTKLLGWVSTRVRELEPEPEPEPLPAKVSEGTGGSRLKAGKEAGGTSAAERKARDQMRLESSRAGPAIIMDMDD